MLYQFDIGGSDLRQIFATFDLAPSPGQTDDDAPLEPISKNRRRRRESAFEYARALVSGTVEKVQEIDALIASQADNWRLSRMPVVDRNVLRLAIYEMLAEEDIPKLVVVDEAIELAKRFGSENSSRFVNGLLDGLLKQRRFPGKLS